MVNESIVKVAIMARRAGMSYGAYVAQNPHGLPRDEAGMHAKVNIPGVQRYCYVCGTPLPPGNRNYCTQECRMVGMRMKAQERERKRQAIMGDAPKKRGRPRKDGN